MLLGITFFLSTTDSGADREAWLSASLRQASKASRSGMAACRATRFKPFSTFSYTGSCGESPRSCRRASLSAAASHQCSQVPNRAGARCDQSAQTCGEAASTLAFARVLNCSSRVSATGGKNMCDAMVCEVALKHCCERPPEHVKERARQSCTSGWPHNLVAALHLPSYAWCATAVATYQFSETRSRAAVEEDPLVCIRS